MERKAMTVRLSEEQAAELEAVARVDNVAVAEEVRAAITAHLEARRKDEQFQKRLRASLEQNQKLLERLSWS
jgi:ribosomal protein S15P/S13E